MNNRGVESFLAVQCLQSRFDTLMENIQRSTDTTNIPDGKNLGILGAEMGEVENLGRGQLTNASGQKISGARLV